MAVIIHYVNIMLMKINETTGLPIGSGGSLSSPSVSYNDVLRFRTEHRVVVDADIPNSANNPTIKNYLVAEAAAGYQLAHIDQFTIITQNLT